MKLKKLNETLFVIYMIGVIIMLGLTITKTDFKFAMPFVMVYMIFILLSGLYFLIITVIKLRRSKKQKLVQILYTAFKFCVGLLVIQYVLSLFIKQVTFDGGEIGRIIVIAFAFSFFTHLFSNETNAEEQ